MRLDDLRTHVEAIKQAAQNMRRLEEEGSQNGREYDHWRSELASHENSIVSNSTWKEFCSAIAHSPRRILASSYKGALIGATSSILALGTMYLISLSSAQNNTPKLSIMLQAIFVYSALAAFFGSHINLIHDSRAIYIDRVCRRFETSDDMRDIETPPPNDARPNRSSDAGSRLLVGSNANELGERQPSRTFS
jgi:hypothetical protein